MKRVCTKWTQEEIELLKKEFPNNPTKSILHLFPTRNQQTIDQKACMLGIKKSEERIQEHLKRQGRLFKEQPYWQGKKAPEYMVQKNRENKKKWHEQNKTYNWINLEERKEEIITMYERGLSSKMIAKEIGCSLQTILRNLTKWNIQIREGYKKMSKNYPADDGHILRSSVEREIDNFLFHNGILHQTGKHIGTTNYQTDFYLTDHNIWIEYWGLERIPSYYQKTKIKKQLYEELHLQLFEIFPHDNLKQKLNALLNTIKPEQKRIKDYE